VIKIQFVGAFILIYASLSQLPTTASRTAI